MSLVDVETGEVVDVADRADATAICAEISAHVAHVNAHLGQLADHIAEGMRRKVWISLGYGSWTELVDAKGWVFRAATIPERVAIVEMLRTNGMSLRAIGKLVGTGVATVHEDLAAAGVRNPNTSATEPTEPATIVGQDGKQYPAARPTPAPSTDAEPTPSGDMADVDGADLPAGAGTVPSITEPTATATPGEPAPAGEPTDDVAEVIAAVMAGTPEEQARSRHLNRWFSQAGAWGPHDPEALAEAAPYAVNDLDDAIDRFERRVVEFAATYRKARRSGLRVLEGGRR